jgi:hypothetical protein
MLKVRINEFYYRSMILKGPRFESGRKANSLTENDSCKDKESLDHHFIAIKWQIWSTRVVHRAKTAGDKEM